MGKPTEAEIQQPTINVPSLSTDVVWSKDCCCGHTLDQHAEDGHCLECNCLQFKVRGWVAV